MALYDAFISYSHAKDKPIAAALQSVVQKLGKPWYRRRALRVFRDDTSLSATPHLWPTIEHALSQSRYFILLASPEAAASKWVNREVAYWLEHKSVDTLLVGVTDGDVAWDEAIGDFARREGMPLPPVLTNQFPSEPKWVDLRSYRDGADPRQAKFIELGAEFAATIREMPKEDLLSQEVRQQRRALTLAWSAVVSLLLLTVAATTAGVIAYRAQLQAVNAEQRANDQKQIAEQQRDRAEKTLAAATQTANSIVNDLAERFQSTVGIPLSLIKDIFDRAIELQQQLTQSGETSPDLQLSEAEALSAAVKTLDTIGDAAGALNIAERARRIMETLIAKDEDNRRWQRALALVYERLGDARFASGKRAEALDAYRMSLAVVERLLQALPGDSDIQEESVRLYTLMLQQLSSLGRYQEALAAGQQALDAANKLAAIDQQNDRWQGNVSVTHLAMAMLLSSLGKNDEAIPQYREAMDILEKLASRHSDNLVWSRRLGETYINFGVALGQLGKLDEALISSQKAAVVLEKLAESDHSNVESQRQLLRSRMYIGDILKAQGKIDEALATYREILPLLQKLIEGDNRPVFFWDSLASIYERIGSILEVEKQADEALANYQMAASILHKLVDEERNSSYLQRRLASNYMNISYIFIAQGKLEEALVARRETVAIRKALVAKDESNIEWQKDLQSGIDAIGGIAYRFLLARDFTRALEVADESIALAPDTTWLYTNLAHALMFLGRVEEARSIYLKHRGKRTQGAKTWEISILEDFDELRKVGLTHPLMNEIEKLFSTRG